MKNIYILLLSFSCAVFSSCNEWLDVSPRSQIKSTVLFNTEDGYKQALNGVYIKASDPGLYGEYTSMHITDALARMWSFPAEKTAFLNGLSTHNYTMGAVESSLTSIFSNYYNAIAQLNDILYNIENTKVPFQHNNDKLIKGEILGLRAFLHLDLLRLFGPIPLDAKDNDEAIPYVTELTKKNEQLLYKNWKEVLLAIENDLNGAEKLLKEYDPIVNISIDDLKNTSNVGKNKMPADTWQYYRQSRFNYFAVLGTKARFYHWIGDKTNSVKYAKMVIDSGKFELFNESSFSGKDASLTMYKEHLFGLQNPDLEEITESLFKNDKAILTQTTTLVNSCYESTIHVNDIRNVTNRYWQEKTYANSEKTNHFYKYIGNGTIDSDKRIPLLRYVEMYFILIEDLPLNMAKNYFITYRQSRALSGIIDETSMSDENAVVGRLEKEYRKEFYGEGQLFFFYKRHKYSMFTWPDTYSMELAAYVIPKPKGISDFE